VTTRIRITLAYDGTGFSGWAKQPHRPSVAGSLEAALAKVFRIDGRNLKLVVAGRTDAGVHAMGQICHLDFLEEVNLPTDEAGWDRLAGRLQGALGGSTAIVVHRVSAAPEGFDARFSPLSRRYSYRIADRDAIKDPRTRGFTLWWPEALAEGVMNTLGAELLGLHDWASFCRSREGATTIRDLQEFSWTRQHDGVLVAQVVADAFCHSMVRSLVGASVAVGSGRRTVAEVIRAREARERTSLWKTMPAHGLTLDEVVYPPDSELLGRQEATRAKRQLTSD
jgi:tRNA pseudouridine38-40 synthase